MLKSLAFDKQRLIGILRKTLASLCLSAGVLSVATIDSLYTENEHAGDLVKARIAKSRQVLETRTFRAKQLLNSQSSSLRESLAQDEFGEVNPFASLSSLDPLTAILERKVKSFQRQAFRSPDHQEESGYDLVHYEIQLADGGRADILAYLERASLTSERGVGAGAPEDRVPFVVIMNESKDSTAYAYYRAGDLLENAILPLSETRALLAQRLSAGVPFLSVAR